MVSRETKKVNKDVETVPLNEIATLQNGKSITKAAAVDGEFPVIAGGRGTVPYTHNQSNAEGECFTLSKSGAHAGFVWWHKKPIWASDSIVVRSRNEDEFLSFYIYLYMKAKQEEIYSHQHGAGQPHVYITHIKSFPIPRFSMEKQKQIIAILDEAFEGLDRAQENAEAKKAGAQELRQSILEKAFAGEFGGVGKDGWEVKALGEFSEIKYGYTAKANSDQVGPRFLRITDIQNGKVNWNNVPYCQISERDHIRNRLEKGDIVFARTGATTGKSYLIENAPDAICASYLIKVRSNETLALAKYLNMYFQTIEYWKEISSGTEGAAQGGFNASKLKALKIPLPSLEEQHRIIAILDEAFVDILQLERNIDSDMDDLSDLRQSLLQKAFAGELTS